MSLPNEKLTCYDAIRDLDDAANDILAPEQQYYVLGGIVTAAINHPDTVFDHDTSHLIAAEDSAEPVRRDNDTLRDVDVLIRDRLSSKEASRIREELTRAIGGSLVVSVFGLTPHFSPGVVNRGVKSVAAWTSERTLDDDGVLRYELYPLQKEVPLESYEPWRLEMPKGGQVSTFNPAAHMLAYYMRSISGLRAKDREKVEAMRVNIEADPKFKEQIYDGPLQSWQHFAEMIELFGTNTEAALDLAEEHDILGRDLDIFRKKSEILRSLESNPTLVKYAQKGLLQALLRPFIGSH